MSQSQLTEWREAGERIVFTNGVFDILHAGHVMYLTEAKSRGERLVVGLNSDESVRTLGKGPERPVNPEADRKAVLEGLRAVDMVVVFEESTPEYLIDQIRPDVLVKGGDYDALCTDPNHPAFIVGSESVRSRGGEVEVIPLLPGRSTTNIIKKSRQQ
jgi:D-beta-D-heptose 7-phosphate kinase/D-beta-D-heptose 1-phosphate adenosyltransferase